MTSLTGFGASKSMTPIGWLGLPMLACAAATVLLATPIRIFGWACPSRCSRWRWRSPGR